MNRPLRIALFAAAALVLAAACALVARNEHIIAHGEVLRLELAPIDPRSLLQGDYMRLRFALDSALREHAPRLRPGDVITVQLDEQHRARLPVAGKRSGTVDEYAPGAEESVLRTQALIVRDSGRWLDTGGSVWGRTPFSSGRAPARRWKPRAGANCASRPTARRCWCGCLMKTCNRWARSGSRRRLSPD